MCGYYDDEDCEHDLMMEHVDGDENVGSECHECRGCSAGCDSCLDIHWSDFV